MTETRPRTDAPPTVSAYALKVTDLPVQGESHESISTAAILIVMLTSFLRRSASGKGVRSGRSEVDRRALTGISHRLPKGKRPQECGRGRHECLRHSPMRQTVLDDVAQALVPNAACFL